MRGTGAVGPRTPPDVSEGGVDTSAVVSSATTILHSFKIIGKDNWNTGITEIVSVPLLYLLDLQAQVEGQRTGAAKCVIRYNQIFLILAPRCSPRKALAEL